MRPRHGKSDVDGVSMWSYKVLQGVLQESVEGSMRVLRISFLGDGVGSFGLQVWLFMPGAG